MNRTIVTLAVASLLLGASGNTRAEDPAADYARGRSSFERDDLPGAMDWLRRGADAGHAPSQALLAYILDRAEEDEAALELYRRAAAQGDGDGLFGLAGMYAAGEGVEVNESQAFELYERAARSGHAPSQLVLAEAYLNGGLGLSRDRTRGEALLREAVAQSYRPAVDRLARLEREGQGG